MKLVLRLKHWQVFIILLVAMAVNNISVETIPGAAAIIPLLGGITCFLFWLAVGHRLYQLLLDKIDLHYNFFLINSFVWLLTYAAIYILSDGQGMTFTGIEALLFFYVFFAFFHFLLFPIRILKSIERNEKVQVSECIGDILLVIFFPIGIWFLQPRINKVAISNHEDEEAP